MVHLHLKKEIDMGGIDFVFDQKGKKKAVIIDLKKYARLWEDFYDSLIASERSDEPRESFDAVKKRLKKSGKLDA